MSDGQESGNNIFPFLSYFKNKSHGKIPLHCSIDITSNCNLRCKHCYIRPDGTSEDLTTNEWRTILNSLADSGCLRLLITGGEPFLRQDFLEIYSHAKSLGFLITIFTNGTLLTNEIVDYFKEYPPLLIEISFYGSNEEVGKKVTRNGNYYKDFIRSINKLKDTNIPLILKTSVTVDTIDDLPAMEEYASNINIPFKCDPYIIPRIDGSKLPLDYQISPSRLVMLEIKQLEKNGKKIFDYLDNNNANILHMKKLYGCRAGINTCHITSSGYLSPCIISKQLQYDLRSFTFKEAWLRLTTEIATQKVTKYFKCIDCHYRDKCAWCPAKAILYNNDSQSHIQYYCDIFEELAKINHA